MSASSNSKAFVATSSRATFAPVRTFCNTAAASSASTLPLLSASPLTGLLGSGVGASVVVSELVSVTVVVSVVVSVVVAFVVASAETCSRVPVTVIVPMFTEELRPPLVDLSFESTFTPLIV